MLPTQCTSTFWVLFTAPNLQKVDIMFNKSSFIKHGTKWKEFSWLNNGFVLHTWIFPIRLSPRKIHVIGLKEQWEEEANEWFWKGKMHYAAYYLVDQWHDYITKPKLINKEGLLLPNLSQIFIEQSGKLNLLCITTSESQFCKHFQRWSWTTQQNEVPCNSHSFWEHTFKGVNFLAKEKVWGSSGIL